MGAGSIMQGLDLWAIDEAAARQFPLRVVADALERSLLRRLTHHLPQSARSNLRAMVGELRGHDHPDIGHPPQRQLTLVLAAISKRTNYYRHHVARLPRRRPDLPLHAGSSASLSPTQQAALSRVGAALDLLGHDICHMRIQAAAPGGPFVPKVLTGQGKPDRRRPPAAPLRLV